MVKSGEIKLDIVLKNRVRFMPSINKDIFLNILKLAIKKCEIPSKMPYKM